MQEKKKRKPRKKFWNCSDLIDDDISAEWSASKLPWETYLRKRKSKDFILLIECPIKNENI